MFTKTFEGKFFIKLYIFMMFETESVLVGMFECMNVYNTIIMLIIKFNIKKSCVSGGRGEGSQVTDTGYR